MLELHNVMSVCNCRMRITETKYIFIFMNIVIGFIYYEMEILLNVHF